MAIGHFLSEYLRNGVWIFFKAIFAHSGKICVLFLGLIEQQTVDITCLHGKEAKARSGGCVLARSLICHVLMFAVEV